MKRIRIKLYKILRIIGLQRIKIKLLATNNERFIFDRFEEAYFLNLLEDSFEILIADEEIDRLNTIDSTVYYLQEKTGTFKNKK